VDALRKKGEKVHLNILGDGENKKSLQQKITELNLDDYVTLNGIVDKVPEFLWNADIYVHSAVYEPFGLALIEAMSAGLPVVCLDGKGNRDIIKNGENGFMLEENNVEAFAEKILQLMSDKQLYDKISSAALRTASGYDIVSYTDKLIALYEK